MAEQENTACMASIRPWTFWDWLRHRLFPVAPCGLPKAPPHFKEVITNQTLVGIPWRHRLRILISGMAIIDQKIVCEHEVGRAVTGSSFYPIPPIWAMQPSSVICRRPMHGFSIRGAR